MDSSQVPGVEDGPKLSERQEQILQAALRVFSQKGFDAARTKEIAKEAGVSEALLFKNFSTKESLLEQLTRMCMRLVLKPFVFSPVDKIIERHKGASLEELLLVIVRDRVDLIRKNETLLGTIAGEAIRRPALRASFEAEMLPEIMRIFEAVFEPRLKSGELRAGLDIDFIARSATSLVGGYLIISGFFPDRFGRKDDEEEIARIVRLFLDGIRSGGYSKEEGK
jgi:AcrR family transcriptional regulator